MQVSQKSFYALRAIPELVKHENRGLVKTSDITKARTIPQRFLEVIVSQLKQAGFATSRRGNDAGYMAENCLLRESFVFRGMCEELIAAIATKLYKVSS